MKILYLVLPVFFALSLSPALHAQDRDEDEPRPDNAGRTRPRIDPDLESGKEVYRPYLMSVPQTSIPNALFANKDLIVEPSNGQYPQNESSIAINPVRPNVLIGSAVDFRNGGKAYVSTNGGLTWTNSQLGIVHTSWQTGNDPSTAFDYLGNGYVVYGALNYKTDSATKKQVMSGESGIYLSRTTDDGKTWVRSTVIEHVGKMTPDSAFEDKYYIQIDNSASSPRRGMMYMPWKRVIDRDSSTQIVIAHSADSGKTWSVPVAVSPRKPGTSLDTTFGQSFPLSTTGPDGTLYVVWNDGPARSIGFATSGDGGLTFSAPKYVVSRYPTLGTARLSEGEVYHVLKGTFRAETYPALAADNSSSPRKGNLYLAWAAGLHPDIFFSRSTDKGTTWSTPKVVHSDTTNDQWWPWLNVDQTNGDIAVTYSDSRNDSANILIDQYASYSSDGGDTWIDRRTTDAMSDYRKNPTVDQIFAGDYSGNTFYNGKIYPSFLDVRTANGNDQYGSQDNDVYTALADIYQPFPVDSLRADPNPNDFRMATLHWVNPKMETVFGKPITGYQLTVRRDTLLVAQLPMGTTTFTEDTLTHGQQYTYSVTVTSAGDSSIPKFATVRAGGAKEPAAPVLTLVRDYEDQIQMTVTLPTFRADMIVPLSNLKTLRTYRDTTLLREQVLAASDTGLTIPITDAPGQRGYYRYFATVTDADSPANESIHSDTVIAYTGPLTAYSESFDAAQPRFLTTGTWGSTTKVALSAPNSFTDSPVGLYKAKSNDYVQLYPVQVTGPTELKFAQIVIADPTDTAYVESSRDKGMTWQQLGAYTWLSDPAWKDSVANPADWRQEYFTIRPATVGITDTVIVRFRLKTGIARNADGWYLDDIAFGGPAGVETYDVASHLASHLAASIGPNPAGAAAILSYTLPSPASVRIDMYDLLGNRLFSRQIAQESAGRHSVTLDLSDLPAGSYFYEVTSAGDRARGRVVVAR